MHSAEMRYRSLGLCGTQVSVFGLGGWVTFSQQVIDERTGRALIQTAFDAGVNFFDITDVYARGESKE